MQLIGMLDSRCVRRLAISLQLLGLKFEHRPLSVFSTFTQLQHINPVVKAPSVLCDDGEVPMDSTLILDCARDGATAGRLRCARGRTIARVQRRTAQCRHVSLWRLSA